MNKVRLYYVDWLRILVILSLIPYHSALTYTGLGDTYIKSPIKEPEVLPFLIISAPLGSFFMTLLFFISGIATYHSFTKRGSKKFLMERLKKVLLPFILGTLLLCPVQAYFKGLYDGFSGSLIEFIPEFFSKKIVTYLGYAHLWFLLYLLIFTFMCIPLFCRWIKHPEKLQGLSDFLCRGNNIYYPILFIILVEMLLRPFFTGMQTLIMDWANDVVYLSMIVFGFVFACDHRLQERVDELKNISGVIFSVLSAAYIAVSYLWLVHDKDLWIFWAATKGLYECCAIIFILALGKRYLNRKSRTLDYLKKATFSYYIFHFVPICFFTYLVSSFSGNSYAKYLLVVIAAYICVTVLYEIFAKMKTRLSS